MSDTGASSNGTWRQRRGWSTAIRVLVSLLPIAGAVAAAALVARALPAVESVPGLLLWLVVVVVASAVAMRVIQQLAGRLLPLASLLRLTLVFPDSAPNRFRVARGAWSVRELEARLEELRATGSEDHPRAIEHLLSLVAGLGNHDARTRGHSERVRVFADLIGEELQLSEDDRERLRWSALLHDVGKIAVPHGVLNKPAMLDDVEWDAVRRHPIVGAEYAAPLAPWLGEWSKAIEQHHEAFDGTGYPYGLAGQDISLGARIVAVADTFEVMTAVRSYRSPVPATAAREELARVAGTQLDPVIVRAFFNVSITRLRAAIGPIASLLPAPLASALQRLPVESLGTAGTALAVVAAVVAGVVPVPTALADDIGRRAGPATSVSGAPAPAERSLDAITAAPSTAPSMVPPTASPTSASPTSASPAPPTASPKPSAKPSPSVKPVPPPPPPSPSPKPQPLPKRMYLGSAGPGRTVPEVLSLGASAPSRRDLPNYDSSVDDDPGQLVRISDDKEKETDPSRFQAWEFRVDRAAALTGDATFTIWSALADFQPGDGHLDVWLFHCRGSACEELGKGHAKEDDWGGEDGTRWTRRDLVIDDVEAELLAGDRLYLKVVPEGDSDDGMMFAYGTTTYAARLDLPGLVATS